MTALQDRPIQKSNSIIHGTSRLFCKTEWNYFFKGEAWFTQGLLHYSKYPDLYYGIGDNTPNFAEVNFESARIKADIDLLKNIKNKWFAGISTSQTSVTAGLQWSIRN